MNQRELAKALGVIERGLHSVPSIKVIAGDTSARAVKTVFKANDVELAGGGGTDMARLVERAAEDRPDAIVVVTDGWTGWPKLPVQPRVVACLTEEPPGYPVPDWIAKVVLED